MPELPEVETIRIGLEQHLLGHKIEKVDVLFPKIIQQGKVEDIVGATFTKARRLGKVLILDLDNNLSLVIHVKMTGQIIYSKDGSYEPHKHTHVIFHLDGGDPSTRSARSGLRSSNGTSRLFYNDIRKFGWIKIVDSDKLMDDSFVKNLGPEPLFGLTKAKFAEILKGKNTQVKVLIMDQTKLGGVGNIYANDALFMAGIDPTRKSSSLSSSEVARLFKALEEVLKRGIKYGGSSEITYVNALGERGSYQEHSLVYGKTGKPCFRCKSPIQVVRLGGRGTFFCPNCQA